jgi:Golgi SNAP receptor complex protein 2
MILVRVTQPDSEQKAAAERNELLNHPPPPTPGSSDTRRRFTHQHNLVAEQQAHSESPFRTPMPVPLSREHHALNEHSFLQNTDTRLDEFIAQGREVLGDLMDQRGVLKGTQKKLLDAAHTLGLSRDVIGWIERRR